jgi:hypothetical protein
MLYGCSTQQDLPILPDSKQIGITYYHICTFVSGNIGFIALMRGLNNNHMHS